VGGCLLQKCQTQLAGCLADVNCLQNLVCLNKCNGRPDERNCQIKCAQLVFNTVHRIWLHAHPELQLGMRSRRILHGARALGSQAT
jgi:VDE lipocalin domain